MHPLADALGRLYARVPLGMRMELDTMRAACARVGHPERALPVVHVAGTNGKGSVCAMVEAIARAGGLRTGLYTSPHLCRFAERIRVDGLPIDDTTLAPLLSRALDVEPALSFFEAATLAALLAFRDARVDVAVLEVGLGGRLDATNVVPAPRAAAITRIALDHTDRLGSTLADIAREKAGIAKPGLDIVLGPMPEDLRSVIDAVARSVGATTSTVDRVPAPARVGLDGDHQKDNARVAAVLGARIGASPAAIAEGIAGARWPGRLERIGPFLLDAAHNPDGAEALARHVRALGLPPGEVGLIFGALADKDWRRMLDALTPLASERCYVLAGAGARAAVDPALMAGSYGGITAAGASEACSLFERRMRQAGQAGQGAAPSLVVVAGSMLVVGEARARLLSLPRDPPVAL